MRKRTTMNPVPGNPDVGGGYWVNCDMVDRIRNSCKRSAKLLAIYCALNWVATDYKERSFRVTRAHLGELSGLSPGTVAECLEHLALINVIEVVPSYGASAIEGLVKVTLLGEVRL
jgi:hypothetical protein